MSDRIPDLVYRDIKEAVISAILFGVSVEDFKRISAEYWDETLRQKREWDARKFSE